MQTEELIQKTQRFWGCKLGRNIPRDEAIEMIQNARMLLDVLGD